MSLELEYPRRVALGNPRVLGRLAWLGLLAAELLALTLRYDIKTISPERTWGAGLLQHVWLIPRIALAVGAALAIMMSSRLQRRPHDESEPLARPARTWPFLVGHLAAFAGLFRLTGLIFEGNTRSLAYPGAWVFAWVVSGLASLILWAVVMLPPRLRSVWRSGLTGVLLAVPLGLAAWSASWLTSQLWAPLNRSTFWMTRALVSLFSRQAVCRPDESVLGTESFRVAIAPECSGYEGIGLILVLLGTYLWWFRRRLRFPRAWLLLPLGMISSWLANVIRIAALIWIGDRISPEVAMGGFHSVAGWLTFNAIGLGLIGAAHRMPWFSKHAPDSDRAGSRDAPRAVNPAAAYLVPLLVLIATMMVTSAFGAGFDKLYPGRVLTVGAALWGFRRAYRSIIRWTWSWWSVAIGIGVFVLWIALEPRSEATGAGTALRAGLARLPTGWALVWVLARVVGSVVTVPLAEELAFRGFLTRRLIAEDFARVPLGQFTWVSFLVSSALFGALHGRWLAGTLAGMLYALALYRRRELADAVLAHAVTNALIAVAVLSLGAWGLWS